jgi:hypothetical protein
MSGKISGISGKLFPNSEILKRWNFSENFVFFYKTALRSSVHIIKISVKLVEIVFFEKKSENVSTSPEIPKSGKSAVFRFSGRRKDTAYFWKIREKISGKIGRFRRKISRKSKIRKIPKFGKFRKKCQNVDFGKFNPRLQSAF